MRWMRKSSASEKTATTSFLYDTLFTNHLAYQADVSYPIPEGFHASLRSCCERRGATVRDTSFPLLARRSRGQPRHVCATTGWMVVYGALSPAAVNTLNCAARRAVKRCYTCCGVGRSTIR